MGTIYLLLFIIQKALSIFKKCRICFRISETGFHNFAVFGNNFADAEDTNSTLQTKGRNSEFVSRKGSDDSEKFKK